MNNEEERETLAETFTLDLAQKLEEREITLEEMARVIQEFLYKTIKNKNGA